MPFLADEMWQNLVRGVCDGRAARRPPGRLSGGAPELRDPELLEEMESVKAVVELGRRAATTPASSCASRCGR